MNEQETAAQLHAAFTRLIEGEAEPHDESLIAEHLKSHPESIALLRKQLEVDALLQLEADPAPAAFVESVLSQTLPPAHAEVFVRELAQPFQNPPPRLTRIRHSDAVGSRGDRSPQQQPDYSLECCAHRLSLATWLPEPGSPSGFLKHPLRNLLL